MDLKVALTLGVLTFSISSFAIVPNDKKYEIAKNQLLHLNQELSEVKLSLKGNPDNQTILVLKNNIESEITLIKQKIELYKKLEGLGLIMYSSNQQLASKTPNKPLKQDK